MLHHRLLNTGTRGFAIAPILYLLGLIGVGAGVLFSGYSQILRTNQNISNTLMAKNDLQGTATTLAATSWLSRDQTRLCPPIQARRNQTAVRNVEPGTTIVSDGGPWFRCIGEQPDITHDRHVTGSDRAAARHPAFRWANTMLANIKNSLLATHRVVGAKHLPRCLGAFAWRFNCRYLLKTIHELLAIAATTTPTMPYRLLKLAEARW